jgi:hypothetical protein
VTFNAWPIRDVGDGNIGWIQGRIVGTPTLIAPLSKRPCFYYSHLVPDRGEVTAGVDELVLEDDTGTAIVVLAGARVQIDYDHDAIGGSEGILGPGELVAAYGHCQWERDPDHNRARLYREPLPMRLRVTRTRNLRVWVSEDVPERGAP